MNFALVFFLILPVGAEEPSLPPSWQARWERPSAPERPLKIVHRIPSGRATPEGMRYYERLGLGGLVTNMPFGRDYLRSEKHWRTLAEAVEACRKLGLIVWLYDEEGYPSGEAGGLVLAEDPSFEAAGFF